MKPQDLIDHAHRLTKSAAKKPRQADLRRATSASYYAVFHAIAGMCADTFIGTSGHYKARPAWNRVFRSLDHGYAKAQFTNKKDTLIPVGLRPVAATFVTLQEQRHSADYDPHAQFLRHNVQTHIGQAQNCIDLLAGADLTDRRMFAAWVLFKPKA